jgi:hypothetical protein
VKCVGFRHDGSPCSSMAGRDSTFCRYHETGSGRSLRAIEEGRSPYQLEAAVVPAPTQAALFAEEDLPADPPARSYAGEPLL